MESQVHEANNLLEMSKIIIPSIITIIGFVINILITQNSIKKEVIKKKTDITLAKLEDAPFEILELLDKILNKSKPEIVVKDFKKLTSKIFSYGNKDAIKIVSTMQQHNYSMNLNNSNNTKDYKVMCYYILLCCQIKYDLTNIEVGPEYWFKLRITDYNKTYMEIKESNNRIVNELGLKNFLKIVDKNQENDNSK